MDFPSNVEQVLESDIGDYTKIREFRTSLSEESRVLFDLIFLLGFRTGIYSGLTANDFIPDKVIPKYQVCNNCGFWDTPSYPGNCRIGIEIPENNGSKCIYRKVSNSD